MITKVSMKEIFKIYCHNEL